MADQDPNNNPQHSQNAHDRATWDAVADATAPRLAQHLERMEFQGNSIVPLRNMGLPKKLLAVVMIGPSCKLNLGS